MYKVYEQLRDLKGLKDADVARLTGISRASLSQWKSGYVSDLSYESMRKLADIFGVSVEYLMLGIPDVKQVSESETYIPILGYVAAGLPIEAITDVIGEVAISKRMAQKGQHFALRIKGDSMSPEIMDGDIVVCRVQGEAETNDTVIVQINGDEATCKKVRKVEDGIILKPNNPAHEPLFFSARQVQEKPVQIIGKVVEVRRAYE